MLIMLLDHEFTPIYTYEVMASKPI
jgi:hypothetical protein